MKKKFELSEEEFSAIQEAISNTLSLWNYDFIEGNDGNESAMSMSKETFWKSLRDEFIINGDK